MSQVSAQFELERQHSRRLREGQDYLLRPARLDDGAGIWNLVKSGGVLDLNSSYAYLMLCDRFAETTVVAAGDGEILGFVGAFCPPAQSDVVFVWQIGVSPKMRGQGLGVTLLNELVEQEACEDVSFLETTITPSNEASKRLFQKFARQQQADMNVSVGYSAKHFPDGHEAEHLFRIGPLGSHRGPRAQA